MFRLLVIADDFTGGLDTGIQFAKQGVATTVYLYDRLSPERLQNCRAQVVVVDTESRHIPPEEAGRRVASVTAMAVRAGCRYFYKKTDSTLRGNIGSELSAMLQAAGGTLLTFVPAYPSMGRRTVNGMQYVGSTPVGESEFAQDPFNPVLHSGVAQIIAEQSPIRTRSVGAADCRTLTPAEVPEIVIADAETAKDLSQIAQGLAAGGNLRCMAGCAGFAAMLPELLRLCAAPLPVKAPGGGTLLVCGSIHPQSVLQCRWAAEHCDYLDRPLSIRQMLLETEDASELTDSVRRRLCQGGKAMVRAAGGRELLPQTYAAAQTLEIAEESVPACIAWNMGRLVRRMTEGMDGTTLIVFGGDTLMGIAAALHCVSVSPLQELAPGVVLSRMECEQGGFSLVTKAGGFSDVSVISGVDAALRELRCAGSAEQTP